MKPHDDYRNGDGVAGGAALGEDSDEEEPENELSLVDEGAPARTLAALNALRKSRQHYDAILQANGAELPAHRAVLAAASPYLLRALAAAPAGAALRVPDVDADALQELLEYAYTGRLRVRDASAARKLYRAAWRLRVDTVRNHLAGVLLRRVSPADCLELRALPDLPQEHLEALDAFISQNFDEVCKSGALATLPLIRIEMLRETSAEGGEETALAVAEAALAWLTHQHHDDVDLEELCSRTHLLYVDGTGALRDCGELPAARGDAPELHEYRREAKERVRPRRQPPDPVEDMPLELGARTPRQDFSVLAATRDLQRPARTTRALLALKGRLAAARVAWRDVRGGVRGGILGGEATGEAKRSQLSFPRAAHGTAVLNNKLLVCGGYDRARVLKSAEAYDPVTNEWTALPDMFTPRARFPACVINGTLYAIGGSDGHAELSSVSALQNNAWVSRAKLPLPLSHAAAATLQHTNQLYLIGGWAAGHNLKQVLKYNKEGDSWSEAPPLNTGRSQCGSAYWGGALWVLGGCDAWHCLATTETLVLDPQPAECWTPGPPLPTARRSVGAVAWHDRLVVAGGSDGTTSLRRCEWLDNPENGWKPGPALRKPRASPGLAVLNNTLYAVGGFDGKEFLSCVECLYSPDGEWTSLLAPPSPKPPLEDIPQENEKNKQNEQNEGTQ